MSVHDNWLRKAAIVVSALDHRSADALLDQMPEDQAAKLRRAMMELTAVDDQEQRSAIRQFVVSSAPSDRLATSGVELQLSVGDSSAVTYERPDAHPPRADAKSPLLEQLLDADGEQLTQLLQGEHPQTITVIVSQLPPARASELLLHLPDSIQAEVLRRIAVLDETDPEIIREIQQEIGAKLSHPRQPRSAGMQALEAILAAMDRQGRQHVLTGVAKQNRRMAEQLGYSDQTNKPPRDVTIGSSPLPPLSSKRPGADAALPDEVRTPAMDNTTATHPASEPEPEPAAAAAAKPSQQNATVEYEFSDLASFDDGALGTIFSHADPGIVILALTGAKDGFVDRVLRQLPHREARHVRRQMCRLGPIRLRDIDRAQRELAKLASQLHQQRVVQPAIASKHVSMAA